MNFLSNLLPHFDTGDHLVGSHEKQVTIPGGNNLLCGKHNEPLGNHQQKFSESVRQTRTTDRHLPYLSCQAHQRENDCTTASMHGSHLAVRKCLVSFHLHSIQKRPGHSRFIEQALGLLMACL